MKLWHAQFPPVLRVPRLSSVVRVLWIAVAVFHAWLVLRRFIQGEWGSAADFLKAGLALAGVWYATLKVWRVATVFDAAPRRAFVFAFVLLLGHWLIQSPEPGDTDLFSRIPAATLSVGALTPLLELLAMPLLLAALLMHRGRSRRRTRTPLNPRRMPQPHLPPAALLGLPPLLYDLPPPVSSDDRTGAGFAFSV